MAFPREPIQTSCAETSKYLRKILPCILCARPAQRVLSEIGEILRALCLGRRGQTYFLATMVAFIVSQCLTVEHDYHTSLEERGLCAPFWANLGCSCRGTARKRNSQKDDNELFHSLRTAVRGQRPSSEVTAHALTCASSAKSRRGHTDTNQEAQTETRHAHRRKRTTAQTRKHMNEQAKTNKHALAQTRKHKQTQRHKDANIQPRSPTNAQTHTSKFKQRTDTQSEA